MVFLQPADDLAAMAPSVSAAEDLGHEERAVVGGPDERAVVVGCAGEGRPEGVPVGRALVEVHPADAESRDVHAVVDVPERGAKYV